jgi:peroxiredoxin
MKKNTIILKLVLLSLFITIAQAQEPLYPTLAKGFHAPDIKGKNERGKKCSLSKVKSRLTLLYFYEVHCHLCESIVPRLKDLYEAYHKTGLEILAIPVNSEKGEWKKYIDENKLQWKNIFPTSPEVLQSSYLLSVSPTFYLLDKNHILLTQRLGRIEQVEEELNIHIR